MTIYTGYPDADPETTTVDGRAARSGVDQTFANIRSGAGNNQNDSETGSGSPSLTASATSNQYSLMRRAIWLFDTSSIPSGATINSATLTLRGAAKGNGLGSPDLVIDVPSPASNTAVATADFNIANWAGTEKGRMTYASYSAAGDNVITLNVNCIVKAGITKLGGRLGWDFDNSTTGLTWSSGLNSYFQWTTADNGSNKPTLTVDYTVGGTRRVMVIS